MKGIQGIACGKSTCVDECNGFRNKDRRKRFTEGECVKTNRCQILREHAVGQALAALEAPFADAFQLVRNINALQHGAESESIFADMKNTVR